MYEVLHLRLGMGTVGDTALQGEGGSAQISMAGYVMFFHLG